MDLWRARELPETIARLATRPGHEQVRTLVADLLRHGLGVRFLDHEVRVPEVRGRIDALFGATLFEFKSDLRREDGDVQARVPDYLRERERQTGQRWVAIATDGATFAAYERAGDGLRKLAEHTVRADQGAALLAWLDSVLAARDDLAPEPLLVQRELGRDSPVFRRALAVLEALWAELASHPEAALKRELWDGLLREVYGAPVGDDRLFLQHTYLTVVAKTVAARVLGLQANAAADILSGRALADAGIRGAVESDFFDWPLLRPEGHDLVRRIAAQTARFRLTEAESDVLKALYESLIDPGQRHDLGEYYTPDWLATRLVARVLPQPLGTRVLDPACGSGTFLFHAVRRKLAAAAAAGLPAAEAVRACAEQVRGLDVHPVAVIIARVTWLLALGTTVRDRPPVLDVPVYLGDAMQWNREQTIERQAVVVQVRDAPPLRVPAGFAEEQARFEPGLRVLDEALHHGLRADQIRARLRRIAGVDAADVETLAQTAEQLQALKRQDRNHIWTYVFRNMVRPLWLSSDSQRADVVVGNPPWVALRHLSPSMQNRLREACLRMNLWVGGHLATQQDLCALFFARAAQFYLKPGGVIGFVLPYAALNRPAYAGLRRGDYRDAAVRIDEAWSFDEQVRPLFPVPASVIIGTRAVPGVLPATVARYAGDLPRRDATEAEAAQALRVREEAWPPIPTLTGQSPYRARFRDGATIYPRRFFLVEEVGQGRIGSSHNLPRVRGRAGSQDKKPWRDITPPEGPLERQFLHPVLLGESIGPFRVIAPALAVLPVHERRLLDSAAAVNEGFDNLAGWMQTIERNWEAHAAKRTDGALKVTLGRQVDHMRKLTQQMGASNPRVVYSKAGTILCGAVVQDPNAYVDHMAYWASCNSMDEARYLCAVLNSAVVLNAIQPMQPKGQGGARHFDNLMWELPIPEYNRIQTLHRDLATAAERAEAVAASVPLDPGAYFTQQRRALRHALAADGVMADIDALVARLLAGNTAWTS